ncbi:SGNH/GDSL hydrolase family protein [Nocardioides panacisoli]|uniref:SGNH/GDSL hydrolase family protein n=1 Tax=Nocardioides panacisoli TaxID=627624 RepID=A0ABP7IYB8_9ACTN
MPTRLPLAAVVLVAASLLVAGCDSNEPAPAPAPSPGVVGPGDEYVAMGDSYTSGPRMGHTQAGCLRGSKSYPFLVADELKLDLTDVSCGGATSEAVWNSYTPPHGTTQPPQVSAVTDSTALVTFSFGGNDEHLYSKFLAVCVTPGSDEALRGSPCTRIDKKAYGYVHGVISRTRDRLVHSLNRVVTAAPNAQVVVVGYPRFAPEHPCAEFPIAEGDVALALRLNRGLVRAQKHAAEEAGADYVDLFAATEGHDMCAKDPWLAGMEPTAPAAPYHPYQKEQQVAADLVTELVRKSQP